MSSQSSSSHLDYDSSGSSFYPISPVALPETVNDNNITSSLPAHIVVSTSLPSTTLSPSRSSSLTLYDASVVNPHKFLKTNTPDVLASLLARAPINLLRKWSVHLGIEVKVHRNRKISYSTPLFSHFWTKYNTFLTVDLSSLRSQLDPTRYSYGLPTTRDGIMYDLLLVYYPEDFLRKLINVTRLNKNRSIRASHAVVAQQRTSAILHSEQRIIDSWPQPLDPSFLLSCRESYIRATTITVPRPCVCCGRSFLSNDLSHSIIFSLDETTLPEDHPLLVLLNESPYSEHFWVSPFDRVCPVLNGLMIFHSYVRCNLDTRQLVLDLCSECYSALSRKKLPKFSLGNNLFRGELPDDLKDITWIEEKVCALHRVTADVARLHNAEQNEALPYRLAGNTCAHPVNVPSTARVLPRVPSDISGNLSVVFVGPKFDKKRLPPMFRVRRRVIERFLYFLAANNPLYINVNLSPENLMLYPEDDILPNLEDSVIINDIESSSNVIKQESAAFEQHPLSLSDSLFNDPIAAPSHSCNDVALDAAIESTGVIDFKGSTLSGKSAAATAMYNLLRPRMEGDHPDLIIPRGYSAVNDYDNPSIFPGLFPTLFPFGIGGLEADRPIRISFQEHANYLLSLYDPSFKYHRLFLFVALSIIKKRKGHLQTSFSVKKQSFPALAAVLSSISAETLESTAHCLKNNGSMSNLSPSQQDAMTCLRQLNITSATLPGSPASKLKDRAAMRGYFGVFGLPQIYLTMNPSAAHSPLLQVFLGDSMVDLSQRYPSMPLPDIRAKRIAKDPVAAADFFEFCIRMFLKHLLGFDPESGVSNGGILGHVQAYYGKCECTMRGCLHAHFVIWLLGGLNPRQIHEKLEHDAEFKQRFFEFWEQIIKHDAPYKELTLEKQPDPRTQRPPALNGPHSESTFQYDVKICAEALQRHQCRDVCWKYSNVDHLPRGARPCRFQFPHQIVEKSYYDTATKSVVMACRDETMNFYNPDILTACRHNHDIKSIASGKSAKAAIFYITNYITKDDLHTHHILSMMSATIAHMNEDENATPVDRAKARLQKWISQLSRLQEVHAQMAVMYIRGVGDTFASHTTVPMLSQILLLHVRSAYHERTIDAIMSDTGNESTDNNDADDGSTDAGDAESEEIGIPLRRSSDGMFYTDANQIDDYIHRDEQLAHLSFVEFVCSHHKEKLKRTLVPRLGTYARYSLNAPHPQSTSHSLVQHQDPCLPVHKWKTPPRVIGMQVPKQDSRDYALFMLAHFKPFSHIMPLIPANSSYASAFASYHFPDFAITIMRNWEDIHECEDERDAERIRKKQSKANSLAAANAALALLAQGMGDDDDDIPVIDLDMGMTNDVGRDGLEMAITLKTAGWFQRSVNQNTSTALPPEIPRPSVGLIKIWGQTMRTQEDAIRRSRRDTEGAHTSQTITSSNEIGPQTIQVSNIREEITQTNESNRIFCPETVSITSNQGLETAEEIIQRIGREMTLNREQWIAYLIIARKFITDISASNAGSPLPSPLRMLLTGPGGTGKSHVVKSLTRLMEAYGQGHKIRLLAPTGSAASLINATTIHTGVGIQVKRKKDTKNVNLDSVTFSLPKKRRLQLEDEWRAADWLFCDECSLIGASLNAELDQMLRIIKGVDEFYGGINVVFAGDFSQYPPVHAAPLYEPIGQLSGCKTNADFLKRLGRMAWLSISSVVELTEQKRMAGDPEYSRAVARLRMRCCTSSDVALFNSRVVASPTSAEGVRLTGGQSSASTVIVHDNKTRTYLNKLKAKALEHKGELVMCAARDFKHNGDTLMGEEQRTHLAKDFSTTTSAGGLPSFIPLAVGMTVALRNRNISSDLKIANGSIGTVVALYTSPNGPFQSADGIVVNFPASPIRQPGLPDGCIFIAPESKPYKATYRGNIASYRREQLLVEPAYAVTGHFSQGKTLPVVVANLKRGGPAAYVAASRPTTRRGLFLLQKLTLKDLNNPPLPPILLEELKRLDILKHNTLFEHGFLHGAKQDVPYNSLC